ncbi:hypothetical protein BJ122_102268 [Rhodopseudomonas faecalis]|uniref:Uncharacterized protein n=1 Tax=Rhodopseudomonas faecalis TaxID=99655 RepID=A0A318TJJ7_9BRAD|nr:hypothetical protein [Rhodopseudomonas faecalis]PYF05042.1 hypothetical protein BJ122_102268 [Rhodopseudomonas faecalis]
MQRFDQLYRVWRGDNLGSAEFWNVRLKDIDIRLDARERDAEKIDRAAQELIAIGIQRVNVTFNPLIQQSQQAMADATQLLHDAQAAVQVTINEGASNFNAAIDAANANLSAFISEATEQLGAALAGGVDAGTISSPRPQKIKLLRSTIQGEVPTSLGSGEVAINEADNKLFWRNVGGEVCSLPLATLLSVIKDAPASFDTFKKVADGLAARVLIYGNQTLQGGFAATSGDVGSISGGSYKPIPATGNFQHIVNNGAHTLSPPDAPGSFVVEYTNGASAGALTTSGFAKVTGASYTATAGHKFLMFITRTNSASHLHIQALQ